MLRLWLGCTQSISGRNTAMNRDNLYKMLESDRLFYARRFPHIYGYKYSPDQPRDDHGRWANDGSTGQTNIDGAISHLQDHAEPFSKGYCASYVRRALNAGGFDVKPPDDGGYGYAKNFGPELEKVGFKPVATWSRQFDSSKLPASGYLPDYTPAAGDVAIIQPYPGGKVAGHMTMYDGHQWISDFKQPGMWPGPGYRLHKPDYVIYRYPN